MTIKDLPSELWVGVFTYCHLEELNTIALVCKNFNSIINNEDHNNRNVSDDDDNGNHSISFSVIYYQETRKRIEKLLNPEVMFTGDSDEEIHRKGKALLFDWLDLVEGKIEKHSYLKSFRELRRNLEFLPRDDLYWNQFLESSEKLNSISICGEEKKWFGFTLLDKRGERVPIFCRSSPKYSSSSSEMVFIILGFFDSDDNLTGNFDMAIKIREAQFHYEYLGFDSMVSFTDIDWLLNQFSQRYIQDEKIDLALFGSALEFYVKIVKSTRKHSKTRNFPPINPNRDEYYLHGQLYHLLCFNSLHRGVVGDVYGYSNLDRELNYILFDVNRFYSNQLKLLNEKSSNGTVGEEVEQGIETVRL